MKKEHLRLICISSLICVVASSLLGASNAPEEKEVEQLMEKRTVIMEKVLSGDISFDEGSSKLMQIEDGSLYTRDINSIREYACSDYDRVLSMKTENMQMKGHVADLMIFSCDVLWTCLGYDGIYTKKVSYNIGAEDTGKGLKLVTFEIVK